MGKEARDNVPDPASQEGRERELIRAFEEHQYSRYYDEPSPRAVGKRRRSGGTGSGWVDLGLATWPDGGNLRARSVHSARSGNRSGRH